MGLSTLWGIGAAIFTSVGVLLLLSGRDRDDVSVDPEGFVEFIGAGVVVVGLITVGAAAAGFVLGRRTLRGHGRASLGLAALFFVFALVSGMFLASAIAAESGIDPGGLLTFGLNTAACVAVVVCALGARRA